LAELRAQHARAGAELAAAEETRDRLLELAGELALRGSAHQEVSGAWYASQIIEVEQRLQAGEARRRLTQLELDRKSRLQAAGFTATADLDRARLEHDLATREAQALGARQAMLRTQAEGVQRGIFVDSGQTGAAYTAQRQDEIALRLVDLGRSIASLRAEAQGSAERLATEERRAAQQRLAELPSPADGLLWRRHAQDGERVAPGDLLAEVTDCSAAFVLAAVPQDRAARIQPGAPARLRLAGERGERPGRVVAVLGESAMTREHHLAALPTRGQGSQTLLRVALPPAPPGFPCLVGRSVRLLLPAEGGGLIGRALASLH
jgi:multidrug resistance efflux pump